MSQGLGLSFSDGPILLDGSSAPGFDLLQSWFVGGGLFSGDPTGLAVDAAKTVATRAGPVVEQQTSPDGDAAFASELTASPAPDESFDSSMPGSPCFSSTGSDVSEPHVATPPSHQPSYPDLSSSSLSSSEAVDVDGFLGLSDTDLSRLYMAFGQTDDAEKAPQHHPLAFPHLTGAVGPAPQTGVSAHQGAHAQVEPHQIVGAAAAQLGSESRKLIWELPGEDALLTNLLTASSDPIQGIPIARSAAAAGGGGGGQAGSFFPAGTTAAPPQHYPAPDAAAAAAYSAAYPTGMTGFAMAATGQAVAYSGMPVPYPLAPYGAVPVNYPGYPFASHSGVYYSGYANAPVVAYPTPQPSAPASAPPKPRVAASAVNPAAQSTSPPSKGSGGVLPGSTTAPAPARKVRERDNKTRRFACPEEGCGRLFARAFNLYTHVATHRNHRPFDCPVPPSDRDGAFCGKSFSRRHDLGRHLQAVHEGWLKEIGKTASQAAAPVKKRVGFRLKCDPDKSEGATGIITAEVVDADDSAQSVSSSSPEDSEGLPQIEGSSSASHRASIASTTGGGDFDRSIVAPQHQQQHRADDVASAYFDLQIGSSSQMYPSHYG